MSRSAHSVLASPATRATTALPPHPPTRSEGPDDPARISPLHLPALHHIAADLDGLNAPVKIVPAPTRPADELGVCVECATGIHRDIPVWDAVAVVRAVDPYDHESRDEVCAVHLHDVVSQHHRRERLVVVDVPAQDGRKWFERSERETFYAVSAHDPLTGVAASRGIWDAWQVVEVVDGFGSPTLLASVGLRDGESFNDCRARAEVLAQAVAARIAADAYEASFSDAVTVALPAVAAVSGVAA